MPLVRKRTVALAVLALLVGCSQVDNPGKTTHPGSPTVRDTRSEVLSRGQFPDIPVPEGFSLVSRGNRSFSYVGGGVRVGRFHYWGRGAMPDVVAFYRSTMGLRAYAWSLSASSSGDGQDSLTFTKQGDTCEITIQDDAEGATTVLVAVRGTDSGS
jgi:hypothetical protein